MHVSDVRHLTIADVLERADAAHAIALDEEQAAIAAQPNAATPWPHLNPAPGTWRLDQDQGTFEVLVLVDPWEVEISEGDHEFARQISPHYRQWLQEGRVPPAITVVRHVRGYLNALNRRRVLAARDTNTPLIPAWFSETTPSGGPLWRSLRHGLVYQDIASIFGWNYVLANY